MPPKPCVGFRFGPYQCSWSEAFVLTRLSLCLVNHKPLVPGHVLVIPRRVVASFEDLHSDELADLWATAHRVAPVVRDTFGGEALTFAIQDGPAAGQTVPHTHIHILPRKKGDFKRNDDIYGASSMDCFSTLFLFVYIFRCDPFAMQTFTSGAGF